MHVGYLVPEFPGQTHAFFWREIGLLERLGVKVDIISTRRPSQGAPHRWADAAIGRTTYLHPMPKAAALGSLWQLIRPGPLAWWRSAGMIVRSPRRAVRMTGLAMMGARLAALARKRGWSHLHVHSCADAAHIALFAHLLSGLPYSLTLHGDLTGYGCNQAQKWGHAKFGIVICEPLREQVSQLVGPRLPAWIATAPMGVNLEDFTRQTPYVPFRGAGPLRVFSCGRLHPGKGQEDLIRAAALARRDGLDARLTIAGQDADGGRFKARLEALIAECGLEGFVRLAGALSEQAVRDHLEASHLFALASHQEALGVATMEAMAMELPVIVTRVGGVSHLVEDGREGVMVEPHSPMQLAAALVSLSNLPATCISMGQAGRRKVEAKFHSGLSARAIVDGLHRTRGGSRQESETQAPAAAFMR